MNEQNNNNNQNPQRRRRIDFGVLIISVLLIIGIWLAFSNLLGSSTKQFTYNEFRTLVDSQDAQNKVETVTAQVVGGSNYDLFTVSGTYLVNGESHDFEVVVTYDQLNDLTEDIDITIVPRSSNTWLSIILNLLPYVILIAFLVYMMRSSGGNKEAFNFAKSTAKMAKGKQVTFEDVAGCEEEKQELVEVVDFLKNPKKYVEIGARIPKGVLLCGSPGTGKTLLAKAVAGEAGVPFFSISGSDFVEMFVGVGASRVRDLFKTAKEHAPCIIFIDEIDAVGRQRGAGMGGGHDEREQTLNQLLVEMDGFNANIGIIVMAATNRPDVLDPALLRPGRFDRQITIANPDVKGREAILKVHARNKHFASDVKFDEIAQRIPGFSGADIENLLNEAALLAARDNRKEINKFDIDEATDRVLMGPAKKSRVITEKEKNRVAYHEAGHAVIGLKLENSNIVQKVTIVPRGQAGGYNLMLPEEETYLETNLTLTDQICGYLGGRVAEEIIFNNEISTGASNDFERATKIARAMVTQFGMSNLGPVQYEKPQGSVFLGRDYLKDKDFSDQIALEIDNETRRIIEDCYAKAKNCISENLDLLTNIAEYLKKVETLTKSDIEEIEKTGKLKWYDEQQERKAREAAEIEAKKAELEKRLKELNETLEAKAKNDASSTTVESNDSNVIEGEVIEEKTDDTSSTTEDETKEEN